MKKILFLLLITVAGYGQTLQNPTFGTVKIMNSATVITTPALTTTEANGLQSKITPANLPVSTDTQTALDLKLSKTGESFNYAIDFDDILSQNSGLTIGKRSLKPESTSLPFSYTTILAWGDSLTAGSGSTPGFSYPSYLATLSAFNILNKGVGGETSTQIKDRFIAETGNYDKTVIIWAGRNNFTSPTTVKADIATIISTLTHDRYLVVGIINGDYSSEWSSGINYPVINQLNEDLKTIYGKKYVPIREYLVSLHNNSAQDLIDFGHDIVPTSLRSDNIHLNDTGYTKVAEYIFQRLGILFNQEGYLQSKDIKGLVEDYNFMHLYADETFTGIKSATNTGSGVLNGFNLTNSGTGLTAGSINVNVTGISNGIYGTSGNGGSIYGGSVSGSGSYGLRLGNSSSAGIRIDNSTGATQAVQVLTSGSMRGVNVANSGTAESYLSSSTSSGTGYSATIQTGIGFLGVLGSSGRGLEISGAAGVSGVLARFNSNTTATGDMMQFRKNSVDITTVNSNGIITTPSPIISSETANTIASFDASKNLKSLSTATYPSLTELAYVKGVSSAIQTQIDTKAPLASPILTGIPTAPTASTGTNTTQLATTAFVKNAIDTDVNVQKISDSSVDVAVIDSGASIINWFGGDPYNRTFYVRNGDELNENYSDFGVEVGRVLFQNVATNFTSSINLEDGVFLYQENTVGGERTTVGFDTPVADTTINNPALPAGSYSYSVAKVYSNSSTVVLTSATLSSTYSSALPGDKVHALSIIAGALIYEKTASGWVQYPVTVTP